MWYSNPWLIGIGTSLVGGVVVFFITNALFAKKKSNEYIQSVQMCNRDIVGIIRPLIAEGHFPKYEIFEHIINSTARTYKVNLKDIYKVSHIVEDLIKEITESSFIAGQQKINICNDILHNYKDCSKQVSTEQIEVAASQIQYDNKKTNFYRELSMIFASITTVLLFYVTMKELDVSLSPATISLIAAYMVMGIAVSFSITFRKRKTRLSHELQKTLNESRDRIMKDIKSNRQSIT